MGGAARQGEGAVPWLLTVLVMWLLEALRQGAGGPVRASLLLRELRDNFGREVARREIAAELDLACKALEELDEAGCLDVSGEGVDPLLALTPLGEDVLEKEDAQARELSCRVGRSVEEIGIRGPLPGARMLAMGYLRQLGGGAPRPTVH